MFAACADSDLALIAVVNFFDAFAKAFLDILNAVFLCTILDQLLEVLVIIKSQNLH